MKTKYFITMIMVLLAYYSPGWSQSSNQNYIIKKKMTNSSGSASRDVIQYYDGLGRPNETVSKKFTPNGYDMVTRQEYDAFGRKSKTWLPSPNSNTNGNYNGTSTAVSKYGDDYPYNETVYEPSPLNRPERQYGPGQTWRPNDHKVKTEYLTNSSTGELKCALYSVSGYNLVRNGLYTNNTLFVTKTTDENNNVSYEFKDKLDRVVLQRQMENQEPYDTYYVYDDYGNLSFVLPPLAADNTTSTSITYSETSDPINKYAYLYRYDNRNRCTEKKLPGAGWIYMVYDKADRLVLSQDAAQRGVQWTFYKYDNLGRMVLSGYKLGDNNAFQQDKALCSNAVTVESRVNGGGVIYRYTNNSYPRITMADTKIINYYDDHLWLDYFNNEGTPDLNALTYNTKSGFGTNHSSEQGMLTGNYTKLLDASARSVTANYYDNKGQLVQNCVINMKAGFDRTFFNYNFDGSVDKKQSEQTGMASQPTTTELYKYNYDTQGRLTSTDYTLNNATTPVRISTLTYNELGQVGKKVTGGLETTEYSYNIRSWMENITGSRFSEQLLYTSNIHYGAPIFFNGNISAMRWIAQDKPGQYRGYDFNYDQLGRLINASYGEGVNLDSGNGRYDEHSAYDKHGNFTYIIRSGRHDDNTFSTIDNIHCQQYDGNKVVSIHDFNGDEILEDVMEFKNGNWGGIEYTYDANGNMTKDLNKKISLIQYNELNLPKRIDFQNGNWIQYTYDASGVKHKVVHYAIRDGAGITTTTEYLGNKIFTDGQLNRILTEEGYIAKQGSAYNAFYFIKDHLGNNRVVIDQLGNVQQVTNYYPFGASYAEIPKRLDQGVQPYKYNGKEFDKEGGLNMYDYGARMYDPAIGRFATMDPLAEKYYSISPYAYCANNPINYTDPTGMWIQYRDSTGGYRYENGQWYQYQTSGKNIGQYTAYTPASGSFLEGVLNGLNQLNANATGKELINFFANDDNNTFLVSTNGGNQADISDSASGTIYLNENFQGSQSPVEMGVLVSPFWLDIGHELAHRQDVLKNGTDQANFEWIKNPETKEVIPMSEQYATHIENKMRADARLPLRTHYVRKGFGGWENSRILNPGGISTFYGTNYRLDSILRRLPKK